MKALICTAGEGKRLRPLTNDKPKSLIGVGGKTILEHMLDNLSMAGINEVILIVGYNAESVMEKIGSQYKNCKIKYYINKDYNKTDNMFSLWMARQDIEEGIIFLNADVIFNFQILKILLSSPHPNAVAVDEKIQIGEDSMKVKIIDGKVKQISKKVEKGDAWAIGIYKLSPDGAKKYYQAIEDLLGQGLQGASFVKPLEMISSFLDINVVNIGEFPWVEIDDFNDLQEAKNKIGKILQNDY